MKQDIILAGVGGQGILSIAYVIDNAALADGLFFKQAEVHGMAQRGGAVQSHMRIADGPIWSDLIPKGGADMVLSVEPLEAVRYLDFLRPDGIVVSSSTPYRNIPDYPEITKVLEAVRRTPRSVVVDSEKLAKEAGTVKAQNIVLLGAASSFLILKEASIVATIEDLFRGRGTAVLEANLKAFELGKKAALGS
jgi:indolepyruvate ferredoxin oxidoreductase beta subunit